MLRGREYRPQRRDFDWADWLLIAFTVIAVAFFGYLYVSAYATW